MKPPYNFLAPKRIASLSINSDLLDQTCAVNPDLPPTLEAAIEQALEEQWKTENLSAIQAYNNFVEENGCFSDNHRDFSGS